MEFRLNGEIARSLLVIKMAVVADKSVVRLPPEIGLRIRADRKRLAFLFPDFGFVEPYHREIIAQIKINGDLTPTPSRVAQNNAYAIRDGGALLATPGCAVEDNWLALRTRGSSKQLPCR